MQDRPTILELLEAVRQFLERDVVPALDGPRKFHARVAANVLAIAGRELREGDAFLASEWRRLATVLESTPPTGDRESTAAGPAKAGAATLERAAPGAAPVSAAADREPPADPRALAEAVANLNNELARRIRAGDADHEPFRSAVLAHLRATSEEKLRIANPSYLETQS